MRLDELADLMNVSKKELLEALRQQVQQQNGIEFITRRSEGRSPHPPKGTQNGDHSRAGEHESPGDQTNTRDTKTPPQFPTGTVQHFLPEDVAFWIGVLLTIHQSDWTQVSKKSDFELRKLGNQFALNIVQTIRRAIRRFSKIVLKILEPDSNLNGGAY